MMTDDQRLVAAVRAEEPGAFARLVDRHQKLVWHLIYRMVGHPEDTRDLCQELFLRVHQRLPQFRFDAALGTWIGQIAWSLAARHLRKKRLPLVDLEPREGEETSPALEIRDQLDLEAELERSEGLRLLAVELEALPSLPRTLVTLYHVDELPIAEIAQITRLPAGTIKSQLFRARKTLRDRLVKVLGERP